MKVNGNHYCTIWLKNGVKPAQIIYQRFLPHEFLIEDIKNVDKMCTAIR